MHFLPLLFAISAVASPSPLLAKRVSGTSTVTLSNNTGTPAHLASGFIYGIPGTWYPSVLARIPLTGSCYLSSSPVLVYDQPLNPCRHCQPDTGPFLH